MTERPILAVALADSIHTARWLRMVAAGGWKLVLVPATKGAPNLELTPFQLVRSAADVAALPPGTIGIWSAEPKGWEIPADDLPTPIGFPDRETIVRGATIRRAIVELRPMLLHTMEFQCAGYAALAALRALTGETPPWLVSNWGSDAFLYHRLAEHRPVLMALARRADAMINECARDAALMRRLGFTGFGLPSQPASGGADFSAMARLDDLPPPSSRRLILVKGYHGWAGRALHSLSAIHLAAPALRGYRIRLLVAGPVVRDMAERVAAADGLDIAPAPWVADHGASLARMAEARIMLACSASDGIGTTLLEAMAFGAFPIVSDTGCAEEWLIPERDGFVLSPHDVAGMAEALRRAVSDDALVDAAAPRNRAAVQRGWDMHVNAVQAMAAYRAAIGLGLGCVGT